MLRAHVLALIFFLVGWLVPSTLRADVVNALVHFAGPNGSDPRGALLRTEDGWLYGTTAAGGSAGSGTLFRMTRQGELQTLHNFSWASGISPEAGLVQGRDGTLYGTTRLGGSDYSGAIFSLKPGTALQVLVNFSGFRGYTQPAAGLVLGTDGNFYGTASVGGAAFRMTPEGGLTVLNFFTGANGRSPEAELLQARDGNFYGTTWEGGANNFGTIFRMTPAGALTTLVDFNGTNGRSPKAGLVQGDNGHFYGTTYYGGASNFGTIFKLTPQGALTVLVHFNGTNGRYPAATLVRGADGNFYGTTAFGGDGDRGTVFRLTHTGELTTLHDFSGAEGQQPEAALMQDEDGFLYGTTRKGGESGRGAVFRVDPSAYRDRIAPTLTVDAPATNGVLTKGDHFMVRGTAADNITPTRLNYRLREPGASAYGKWQRGKLQGSGPVRPWDLRLPLDAEGSWRVQVRVADAAGNLSAAVTRTIVVDRTRPTVAVTSPTTASTPIRTERFTLRGTVSDDVAPGGVEYQVQPPGGRYGGWSAGTVTGKKKTRNWSQAIEMRDEGLWRVRVRAVDEAGNRSVPVTRSAVVDRTPPQVVVRTPAKAKVSIKAARYTLEGEATDNVAVGHVELRVQPPGESDYRAWQKVTVKGSSVARTWSRELGVNKRGEWKVQIRAADQAGNASRPATITINRR